MFVALGDLNAFPLKKNTISRDPACVCKMGMYVSWSNLGCLYLLSMTGCLEQSYGGANTTTSSLASIYSQLKMRLEHLQGDIWHGTLRKQCTPMRWANGSCQKIKDLTYQKQVQIHSNWENEIMPEKTIKRAKKILQEKHRAFNQPSDFFLD